MAEPFKKVVLLGCGMIGSSFGLALRQRGLADQIVGLGRRIETLDTALQLGAITSYDTDVARAVQGADLVYLATPVHTLRQYLAQILPLVESDCLVTDGGSIKASLIAEAESAPRGCERFVGGHPMAGSEKTGPEHGDPDLFVGASYYIVPGPRSDPAAILRLEETVSALGSLPVRIQPELHDELVAWTSHLPHAAVYALAYTIGQSDVPDELLAHGIGGGLRDSTRVASSSAAMWCDIFLDNSEHVTDLIRLLRATLERLELLIQEGDPEALQSFLEEARRQRERLIALRQLGRG